MSELKLIEDYFTQLGFKASIAQLYISLHIHGPQTISELARNSGIARIDIYRLLEQLQDSKLVEVEIRHKRSILRAAPVENLNMLIMEREQQAAELRSRLPIVERILHQKAFNLPNTRVNMYSGREGIRQMLWTQLRARGEIVGYNYSVFEDTVGQQFLDKWAQEFERRELTCKLVYGDQFRATWIRPMRIKGMEYYYLAPDVFTITHSCDIYDDTTAYYHWNEGEVFGMEIINRQIADSQRQIFNILLERSTPEHLF